MATRPTQTPLEGWEEAYGHPRARRAVHDALGGAGPAAVHPGRPAGDAERDRPAGRSIRSRAACIRRCTAAGCGRCASSPGFGTAEETNERFRYLLDHGQDGLVDGVRHAVADGPRLRPPAVAGRGRPRGRRDRLARRHGDAVRRHRPRRGQRVDDDQRAGGDHARLLRGRGRGARASRAERLGGHDPGRHPQGVHRPEGVVLPDRPGDAAARRHDRVVQRPRCRAGTRSRSPATTSARRARRPARSWPSRSRTG